jgi:hypothetical protein
MTAHARVSARRQRDRAGSRLSPANGWLGDAPPKGGLPESTIDIVASTHHGDR